jgi:hypothetical protein
VVLEVNGTVIVDLSDDDPTEQGSPPTMQLHLSAKYDGKYGQTLLPHIKSEVKHLLGQLDGKNPSSAVLFSSPDKDYQISVEFMRKLLSDGFLNDEVLQSYLTLLCTGRKDLGVVDPLTLVVSNPRLPRFKEGMTIFWPLNHNNIKHWTLLVIQYDHGVLTAKHYDSYDSKGSTTEGLNRAKTLIKRAHGLSSLTVELMRTPLQENSTDCGVFVLEIAHLLADKQEIHSETKWDTTLLRGRIAIELVRSEIFK